VSARRAQAGLTLVVSMIMLIVLTLLVVSAIRFGNINLRIAGNVQSQVEGAAAAQVAIEQVIQAANNGANLSAPIPAQPVTVSTGGTSYPVTVAQPKCTMSKNVDTKSLQPDTNPADRLCFGQTDPDKLIGAGGAMTTTPSSCKDQQWEIAATVGDGSSGTNVTMLQGVALRVGEEVNCPGAGAPGP